MPMFSFSQSSYETRMLGLLQNQFFITARRNKILAKWAGGRLNYSGAELAKYIRSVIFTYLTVPNDRKVVDKILSDFRRAGIHVTEAEIVRKARAIEDRIKNKIRLSHAG